MPTAKTDKLLSYSGDAVKALVAPMVTHYNLNSFVYAKRFRDNSEFRLGTHPDWLKTYCEHELYRYNVLELEADHYVKGQLLWSQISTHTPILDAVKDFNIANGLTVIRPQHDGCEFYYLGGHVGDRQFGQVLMNNLDILDQFFDYFKYQATDLITHASKEKINISEKLKKNYYSAHDIPCYQDMAVRKKFLNDISKQGVIVNCNNAMIQLTQRELAVVRELLLGKTMVEIGQILFISPRTVETHINHLKSKLHVNKRSELIGSLRVILKS